MRKSIKILGKTIPVWIIATIALVGVASAGLVGYISNTITATTTVASPIELWISNGNGYVKDTTITYSIYGGDTITTYVKSENHASVATSGKVQCTVQNWDGVACADFTSVKYNNNEWSGTCVSVDNYHITLTSPVTWTSGLVKEDTITTSFKSDALGTYAFTCVILPA